MTSHAREAVVDGDHEAFAGARIDDRAAPNATPRRELIAHEVDAPGVVRLLRLRARHARDGEPLPMPSPHGQSFEAIQAFHALVVHVPSVALQLPVQARHPPPRVRGREGPELRAQRRIARRTLRHVAQRRALEAEHATRGPFTDGIAPLDVLDHGAARRRGHRPFPRTSFRIWRLSA